MSKKYIYRRGNGKGNALSYKTAEIPWPEKQLELIQILQQKDNFITFVNGPAGSAKTLAAVYTALELLKQKKAQRIVYVRSAVESADKSLGCLPGLLQEKYEPYVVPLLDKLSEVIGTTAGRQLIDSEIVQAIPVNYLRGLHLTETIIILDEAQNSTKEEITTVITRMGDESRLIVLGDSAQSDLPANKRGGLTSFCDAFANSEDHGIYSFQLGNEDVVRSKKLQYVLEIIGNMKYNTE